VFDITAQLTRREAAKRLGAGVLFTFTASRLGADESKDEPLLTSRLHVAEDGTVTVLTGKVEIGQGIRTTLAQAAAEELKLPPARIRLIMGDTALVPDDGGTWGSMTTPRTVPVIRQACASLRELLRQSAAKIWNIDSAKLNVADGRATSPDGRSYDYVELAKSAVFEVARSTDAALTDPAKWRVCGTPLRSVNGPAIVSGKLTYSSDLIAKDTLFGKVLRGPNHRSKLLGFEDAQARELPGVRVVHEEGVLGVTAPTEVLAEKAARLIQARWSDDELGGPETLFKDLRSRARAPEAGNGGRYPPVMHAGSVEAGMASAAHKLKATYRLAYIAHMPLECRTAVAQWQGDRLTVHCGTQAPFLLRSEIAQALNMPEERVRIVVSDTGSGYGGKHSSECELEAARLSRGITQPVRLAWTRAEESTRVYCRPAAIIDVTSGLSSDGKVVAWDFHNINGGPAGLTPPYAFPNHSVAFHASDSPLQQGSYRSLAAAGNAFARESQMNEMAAIAGVDPLEFRLRNIRDPRLKAVLLRAAHGFGWGKRKAGNGTGFGLACNLEKGGYIALCAELDVNGHEVKLRRFVAAFDAGAVVNPDMLSNQVEGALVQGIGGALFEELKFDRQRILNGVFSGYRLPRFSDTPEIEVHLIDQRNLPSAGAGESPITAVAPAIAAAIYSAGGKRVREMPMLPALQETTESAKIS
jgi:isoquinoline 1-oxidoreductase